MSYIVTDSCIQCKYTDCVEVCPVDCFHEGPNFLVIDPEECIDCGLCVSECPVNAIVAENEASKEQIPFIKLNEQLSMNWPVINKQKEPLPTAEEYKAISHKIHLLKKI